MINNIIRAILINFFKLKGVLYIFIIGCKIVKIRPIIMLKKNLIKRSKLSMIIRINFTKYKK